MKAARKALGFLKGEVVLSAAVALAAASAFVVPPSPAYLSYVDWDTLALLFSLMAVMKGFQRLGLFEAVGCRLLKRTATSRAMVAVLVFLPFVSSMVITNDVSLITFVPFGLIVLRMAGREDLAVPVVALQTLAANLGSMLTPMGNPQNLYLYSQSGMGFGRLCAVMAPYAALSAVCVGAAGAALPSRPVGKLGVTAYLQSGKGLLVWTAGFALCLLAIFDVLPPLAVAAAVLVCLLVWDRQVLRSVDYALLGTFLAFFVFIGNLSAIPQFRQLLARLLEGRVVVVGVLASQVISNVPAALLLSGFTQDWEGLLIGTNLGGLGTLIASMASLISYKQLSREYPEKRGAYFGWFTASNLAVLALLLGEYSLLGALG